MSILNVFNLIQIIYIPGANKEKKYYIAVSSQSNETFVFSIKMSAL